MAETYTQLTDEDRRGFRGCAARTGLRSDPKAIRHSGRAYEIYFDEVVYAYERSRTERQFGARAS